MHSLAAAATASSSLSRSSSASSLFRRSLPFPGPKLALSTISSCTFKTKPTSNPSAIPPTIPFRGTGLRVRTVGFVKNSRFRSPASSQDNGHDRLAKRMDIRSFASRKDRREMEAGGGESANFKPDMASLRTGFSKKFPSENSSGFRYDWEEDDEDDEDDGVEVKSFTGGNSGRAQAPNSSNSVRDGYNPRAGRPREEGTGNERRSSQGNGRQGAGLQEARNQRGARSFQEDDRNSGYRGNRGERKASNVGSSSSSSRQGRRGREAYGGGAWSKDTPIFEDEEKKKPVIEPVNFTSAMSKSPHVAILGGGMSGLVCALTLEEHGIQSTVFDTGKHGLGGRMGTRFVEEHNGARLVFDHAAQYFTVTDARFQKLVDGWISEGAVKEWSGNVGTLQAGGQYSELPPATRYIGTNGMRSLADHMLSQSRQISVKRPCWISSMAAENGRWKLTENRKPQGEFDAVVIAHNGKCANRLLSTAHVPLVARQMKRLELSSVWALLAAFEEPLPLPGGKVVDGAFVDGVDSLSWMGNNSRKLVLPDDKSSQCWTFFSTAAYGKKNKVPQESIPAAKAQKVKQDMLHGVEAALGISEDSLPTPIYTRLQLWGAALPTNTPDVPCIFDAHGRVGICGDWLVGSSLEAAALSGMALADHIAKYRDHGDDNAEEFDIGLQDSFLAVKGRDIGQFPGTEESPQQSPQEALAIA